MPLGLCSIFEAIARTLLFARAATAAKESTAHGALALHAPERRSRRRATRGRLQDALTEGNKCYVDGDGIELRAHRGYFYEAGAAMGFSPTAARNLASESSTAATRARRSRLFLEALADASRGARGGADFAGVLQARGGYESTREASLLLRDVVGRHAGAGAWANLGSGGAADAGAPKLDAIKCFQRGITRAEAVERAPGHAGRVGRTHPPVARDVEVYYGLGACLADLNTTHASRPTATARCW